MATNKKNIYLFSFVLNFFKCLNPQPGFFSLSEVFTKKISKIERNKISFIPLRRSVLARSVSARSDSIKYHLCSVSFRTVCVDFRFFIVPFHFVQLQPVPFQSFPFVQGGVISFCLTPFHQWGS